MGVTNLTYSSHHVNISEEGQISVSYVVAQLLLGNEIHLDCSLKLPASKLAFHE